MVWRTTMRREVDDGSRIRIFRGPVPPPLELGFEATGTAGFWYVDDRLGMVLVHPGCSLECGGLMAARLGPPDVVDPRGNVEHPVLQAWTHEPVSLTLATTIFSDGDTSVILEARHAEWFDVRVSEFTERVYE